MSCPLCAASPDRAGVERHGRFTLHWCARCDIQFADPMEEAGREFYESSPLYGGPEVAYTSPRFLNWDQRRFLRDRPRAGGALLDVGCGAGSFLAAARDVGYRVTGLDLSRPQLEAARRRFGLSDLHPMLLADYARAPARRSFDVITAFQVLEHVASPVDFIADVGRLLASGGYLAVGVPNWRSWFRDPLDAPPNHLTRWSRQSLTGVLERGGFSVIRVAEHRSAYNALLRRLRLGVLRRLMRRATPSGATASPPNATVLALSLAKVRMLTVLDFPARLALRALRAPGVSLYALAQLPE